MMLGTTDNKKMRKLIVAFRKFAKAPKNEWNYASNLQHALACTNSRVINLTHFTSLYRRPAVQECTVFRQITWTKLAPIPRNVERIFRQICTHPSQDTVDKPKPQTRDCWLTISRPHFCFVSISKFPGPVTCISSPMQQIRWDPLLNDALGQTCAATLIYTAKAYTGSGRKTPQTLNLMVD